MLSLKMIKSAPISRSSVEVIAAAVRTATAIAEQPNTSVTPVESAEIYAEAKVDSKTVTSYIGSDAKVESTGTAVDDGIAVAALSETTLDARASGDLSRFVDADQISDWATEAMKWAVSLGLIQGKGKDNLDPGAVATRAEIAAIMLRYIEICAKVLLLDDDLLETGMRNNSAA